MELPEEITGLLFLFQSHMCAKNPWESLTANLKVPCVPFWELFASQLGRGTSLVSPTSFYSPPPRKVSSAVLPNVVCLTIPTPTTARKAF